jgi:hypothetical protein
MKKIKLLLVTIFTGFSVAAIAAVPVGAIEVFDECENIPDSAVCQSTGTEGDDLPSMAQIIVNTLLVVLGMVAVVMIVVGGFRYTLSRGEASEIKTAKDIILYAIIGLIVAIMAYAIVNFVLDWF